jgi:chromate transporter
VNDNPLPHLVLTIAGLSLVAVGGGNSVLPEMHRQFVDVAHWFSDAEFNQMYALAQVSPGPNVLVVAVFGWRAAGLAGAVLGPLAMCVPSSILTLVLGRLWHRFREAPWRIRIAAGLVPVSVGLVLSSGSVLAGNQDTNLMALALTSVTVIVTVATRLNPLWCLGAAGLLGLITSLV